MNGEVRNIWSGQMLLGEGPVWDARHGALWFVDIKRRQLHRRIEAGGAISSWTAPAQIGWTLPAEGGGMIAGLQTGLAHFDPETGEFSPIATVEPHIPTNRLNDATVGPDGTIWFGSMDDGQVAVSGRVYRWDGRCVVPTPIEPVPITNGPAISPDGAILYHVDTVGGLIHAVSIDADGNTGAVSPFVQIDPAEGSPDGVSVDAAGNVWVGLWGGWCVRCYSRDGRLLREVKFPVANVTKVSFGGTDLRTAYVTTARIGLDDVTIATQPEAGDLFAFDVEIPGQVLPLARMIASRR